MVTAVTQQSQQKRPHTVGIVDIDRLRLEGFRRGGACAGQARSPCALATCHTLLLLFFSLLAALRDGHTAREARVRAVLSALDAPGCSTSLFRQTARARARTHTHTHTQYETETHVLSSDHQTDLEL